MRRRASKSPSKEAVLLSKHLTAKAWENIYHLIVLDRITVLLFPEYIAKLVVWKYFFGGGHLFEKKAHCITSPPGTQTQEGKVPLNNMSGQLTMLPDMQEQHTASKGSKQVSYQGLSGGLITWDSLSDAQMSSGPSWLFSWSHLHYELLKVRSNGRFTSLVQHLAPPHHISGGT
jgi:hypothetical protein